MRPPNESLLRPPVNHDAVRLAWQRGMFGAIDPTRYRRPWGVRIYMHVNRLSARCATRFELEVRRDEMLHVVQRTIPDRELEMAAAPSVMAAFMCGVGREMAMELAPRLYEQDPRIGMLFLGSDGWPECPLFDRPDGRDQITRRILSDFYHERARLPDTYRGCSYCGKTRNPAWGGGNIGWICADHLRERGIEPHRFRAFPQ